jgi:hypothetical protein
MVLAQRARADAEDPEDTGHLTVEIWSVTLWPCAQLVKSPRGSPSRHRRPRVWPSFVSDVLAGTRRPPALRGHLCEVAAPLIRAAST